MNNDLISREALKKAFTEECCGCCDNCSHCMTGYKCELIDNAPTVKAFTEEDMAGAYNEGYACGGRENTRPQGEWVVDMTTREVVCSCCRQSRRDTRTTHIFFCNHCGADMRKGGAV